MSEQAPCIEGVAAGPSSGEQADRSVWVTIGWVCAFLFPLAGFVIGFFLPRRYSQQGLWIMAVSVVVGVVLITVTK